MLHPGDVIDNTYVIESQIGTGSLSVIYKAYHMRLQKYIAMKKIKSEKVSTNRIRIEVDTLKQLHNTFIPQVYDIFEYNGEVFTIMDYIDGYDLKRLVENGFNFTQEQLIKWFRQLCSALSYIHNRDLPVIHSDIKPENVIIDEFGNVCLIDFNIAGGYGFTRDFASPEQYAKIALMLQGDYRANDYVIDSRSDIYSLGATFYYLMTGGIIPSLDRNKLVPLTFYAGMPYTEGFAVIIDKAMAFDVNDRYQSADEIISALENIKRSDGRYKKYILMQILSSVIVVTMLVCGVWLIMYGADQNNQRAFYSDYAAMNKIYEKGDYQGTQDKAYDILNNKQYTSVINKRIKAEILYVIGNCYYNEENYTEAADSFESAYRLIDYFDHKEDLYMDYAVSLAKCDKCDNARRLIEEAKKKGLESTSLYYIDAEIAYAMGDYSTALNNASEFLANSSNQPKKARCYLMMSDIYERYNDYENCVLCCKQAVETEENPIGLRRYADMLIKSNAQKNSNDPSYLSVLNKAKEYYRTIYENYTPNEFDYINYGKLCEYTGDYQLCIRVLNEGIKKVGEDYRFYLYLAECSALQNDMNNARMYISKAYTCATEAQKNDKEFKQVQALYNEYYN